MSAERTVSSNACPVRVVMVGISGYGHHYLRALLDRCPAVEAVLIGAVDPLPEQAEITPELKARGVPLFRSLEEFFRAAQADLVVISSPVHFHVPQSLVALEQGCHVLCDKPLGVTVQDIDRLIQKQKEGDREVLVGFQWSYSRAIQSLKADILRGRWGKPRRLKTLCFWPRDLDYYRRNDWAGKIRDPHGVWILDSPAQNAMAHFLHNLLYLLGEQTGTSAVPVKIKAEAYRAFPIENFDTTACRVWTEAGTELLFYASHTSSRDWGPMFSLDFEGAAIGFGETGREIVARDLCGTEVNYGSPEDDDQFQKLFDAIAVVRGKGEVVCGPEASRSQVVCINGIQESVGEITELPPVLVDHNTDGKVTAKAVEQALTICYQRGVLPSEANQSWAKAGRTIDLTGYSFFPSEQPEGKKEKTLSKIDQDE